MLGKEFLISWPEFEVRRADETDTQYAAILEGVPAKIMAIRMIANGIAAAPTVSILPIVRCPGEPFIFSSLLDDVSADWRFPMAIVWQTFVQLWNGWEQKNCPWEMLPMSLSLSMVILSSLILWAGDDEFPPSAQILFSDNFPLSFSAEDMAVVGDITIGTMKKL